MIMVMIMNYLISQSFNINYYDYSYLELEFIKKTYEIGSTYPFKWYEFITKIIGNKLTTYFKDTTMIVSLLNLDNSQVKILFEIIKEYLKNNLIRKVLYKREYIIVHFYSVKTKEIFEKKNLWISICSFYMLKLEMNVEIFLRGVIQKENTKELVDLVVSINNKTYLINSTSPLMNDYDDSEKVFLYYEKTKDLVIPKNTQILKFSFDSDVLLSNFEKLLMLEKVS